MKVRLTIGLGTVILSVAGILLCVLLPGCGRADHALSVPAWEENALQESQTVQEEGSEVLPQQPETLREAAFESMICVYVCGAVNYPDVVKLPEGSRGQDALEAAGGFAEGADREAVNLAAVLTDGQKLYFPTVEEAWEDNTPVQEGGGLVNINTADIAGLCTLPGIGESRAGAIIAYREQNGRFDRIEDIMKVPGIKEGAFEKIKILITVR